MTFKFMNGYIKYNLVTPKMSYDFFFYFDLHILSPYSFRFLEHINAFF